MKNIEEARRFYHETAARGATPIELVVMLYDKALEDMRQALTAMLQSAIESRSKHIGHALIVLQQLQGTLDFEHGGVAARQFEQFYNLVRAKLLESQMRNSAELLREQIRYVSEVRNCWLEANRVLQPRLVPGTMPAAGAAAAEGSVKSEWDA
jgi:flagellar secretion chaperone FliS